MKMVPTQSTLPGKGFSLVPKSKKRVNNPLSTALKYWKDSVYLKSLFTSERPSDVTFIEEVRLQLVSNSLTTCTFIEVT